MSELNFVKNLENDEMVQQDLLNLLRAYAISKKSNIQLPSVRILDEIGGMLDITRSRAKDIADRYVLNFFKEPAFDLQISAPTRLGMFNATADTGDVLDLDPLKQILEVVGFEEQSKNGYKVVATNAIGSNKRFKKLFEYTREYGMKTFSNEKPTNIQFKLKVTKGDETQGATVNLYYTGRIRFSGGYFSGSMDDVRAPLRYISEKFFKIRDNIAVTINNTTATLRMNANVNLVPVYAAIESADGLAKFDDFELKETYEPEKFSIVKKNKKTSKFLYIKFKGPDQSFTINLSVPGSVMIEGATDIDKAIQVVKKFLKSLKKSGLLTRIATPRNLNAVKPKKTQYVRRLNMKPSPEITRRGTSCPKDRRPEPYSFQGKCPKKGHCVRPNPQGQPCCYKTPKSVKYIQEKLDKRYKNANVKVPECVRLAYGIGQNTNNKFENVGRANTGMNIYFDKKVGKNGVNPVGLKIGSRQCLRFSKVALVDIVKRKGLQLPRKVTKPILCDMLSKVAQNNVNTTNPLPRMRNGKLLLGDRVCDTYKKSTLVKYARTLGLSVNKEMSKDDICEKIQSTIKKSPRRKLPENLQKNIKKGKVVLKPVKKTPNNGAGPSRTKTPTPSPKPKTPTPSPSPNKNYSSLLNFARRLGAL